MSRLSVESVVAIVGVLVTLPPSIIILWRLLRKNDKSLDEIEVCCSCNSIPVREQADN